MPAMDTLHAYETLRSKFDEDTAKVLVGAMANLVTPSFADLATKADIQEVKADIEQLRLATKADIEQLRLGTKADVAELRADMQEIKAELIRWLFGAVIALVSAMGLMLRFFY